jgi:glutathione S-transferase
MFALAYVEQVHAIDFSLDEHPRVKAWFERLEGRESTARARAKVESYQQAMMSA